MPWSDCLICNKVTASRNVRYDKKHQQWVVTGKTSVGLYCEPCADTRAVTMNEMARQWKAGEG